MKRLLNYRTRISSVYRLSKMIILLNDERLIPQKRNQIFHTKTEHKYSSYSDQITTKVSRFDLEIVG